MTNNFIENCAFHWLIILQSGTLVKTCACRKRWEIYGQLAEQKLLFEWDRSLNQLQIKIYTVHLKMIYTLFPKAITVECHRYLRKLCSPLTENTSRNNSPCHFKNLLGKLYIVALSHLTIAFLSLGKPIMHKSPYNSIKIRDWKSSRFFNAASQSRPTKQINTSL